MQDAGASFDFSVDFKGTTVDYAVWIDWNQDGTFDLSEQVFYQFYPSSVPNPIITGSITIPTGTLVGDYRMRVRGAFTNGAGAIDPCNTYAWGESRDYKLILPTPCTGAPIAGTVTDILICEDVAFNLSTNGATSGNSGLTYQWEESLDQTTWTDIAGATNATYAMTSGISITIFYRLKVTCANGATTTTSNILEVTLQSANQCYCIPGGNQTGRYISSFSTTGGLQQISNPNSGQSVNVYGDFTNLVAEQIHGQDVSFSAIIQGGSAGGKVWVDWNQNGSFEASEVLYVSSSYQFSQSGTFTVPMTAAVGTTRMRVVSEWGTQTANVGPCETGYTNGEFEDYTFEVTALSSCAGTPDAGTVVDFSVCAGEDFDLTTTGASAGESGLTYQWQESPDGLTWADIVGANAITYTVTGGVSQETQYQLIVTCANSLQTATSGAIIVSLNPIIDCYCVPVFTGTCNADQVDDFVLVGENSTSISDLGTGCAPADAYDDRTTLFTPVDLEKGVSYNVGVKTNSNSNNAAIWIDFNDDGSFDVSEGVGTGALISGVLEDVNLNIPLTAAMGVHRMRVIVAFNETPSDACGTYSWGETHDYLVNIVQVGGFDCSTFTANISGDTDICEGGTSMLSATASAAIDNVVWGGGETGADLIVSDAGVYTATVTSVDGCIETASFEVMNVNPLPTVNGIDVVYNGGGSYTFSPVGATNATDYTWDFEGGGTSNDQSPTRVYAAEGTYLVILTVSNACGEDSTEVTVVYDLTGVDENDLINLKLFPNPADAYINIVNGSSFDMESILVISPIGKVVFNDKVNGYNYQLDVTQFTNGLYHVSITLNNGNVVQRKIAVIK